MREILFRGKRVDNGEWVYGDLIHHDGYVAIWDKNASYVEDFEVIPESVGRYTGLNDKNGNKIFEGDIVLLHDYIVGDIVFECGAFGIGSREQFDYDRLESKIMPITGCNNTLDCCYNDYFISLFELYWNYNQDGNDLTFVEVIGNIHDNPELLEERQNE